MEYSHLCLAMTEQALGKEHVGTAIAAHNLGCVLMRLRELQMAMEAFGRAVAVLEASKAELGGAAHPFLARARESVRLCSAALEREGADAAASP